MKYLKMITVAMALAMGLTGCTNCGVCFPNYRLCKLPCAPLPHNNCPPAPTYATSGPSLSLQ